MNNTHGYKTVVSSILNMHRNWSNQATA